MATIWKKIPGPQSQHAFLVDILAICQIHPPDCFYFSFSILIPYFIPMAAIAFTFPNAFFSDSQKWHMINNQTKSVYHDFPIQNPNKPTSVYHKFYKLRCTDIYIFFPSFFSLFFFFFFGRSVTVLLHDMWCGGLRLTHLTFWQRRCRILVAVEDQWVPPPVHVKRQTPLK